MPRKKAGKTGIDWGLIEVDSDDNKIAISIRLDQEVLDFFKSEGRGYQTKINAVLKSFVKAQGRK